MYKALPTITESADALQHRVRTEQDPQKRQRLYALSLLASGHAPSCLAIAELLAVPRHTVRAWLATYETGGLRALLTLQQAPGKRSALTPAVRAQLQTRLRHPRGFGSYRESQPYLASEHSVPLAYSTGARGRPLPAPGRTHISPPRASEKTLDAVAQVHSTLPAQLLTAGHAAPQRGYPDCRVWAQDESRCGLLPVVRQRITARGIPPVVSAAYRFESLYL
jgi:transposase